MREPMTIAYLTSYYARAADTFIRGEVKQLRFMGHTVHTFSVRRSHEEQNVSEEIRAEQANAEYILEQNLFRLFFAFALMAATHPLRMFAALKLAWRTRSLGVKAFVWQIAYLIEASYLARRLLEKKVQHIHNHIPANSAYVCMFASLLSDVPYSMTVHGPHIFYEPHRWALSVKIERSAFTVCITNFCRSQCMMFAPVHVWEKLIVVRCGLDETFLEAPRVAIPKTRRLVSIGRLCKEKGQIQLVDAVALLRKDGVTIELVLIGDGPSRADIERRIREHGIENAVKRLGWKSSEEVRDEILQSRALVLASLGEGLPVVIMESLALGRPVISTQIAGIPELVEPGVSGWLVPAGSVEPLAEAMREAVTLSPETLAEMGRKGAARVKEDHDAKMESAKLERLIRDSVAEFRKPGGA